MHIVYDHQIFALQTVGGISRYFVELAQRLPHLSDDMHTTVVAPVHINEYLKGSPLRVLGMKMYPFQGKHRIIPFLSRGLSSVIINHIKPSIFHETYYSHYSQSVGAPRVLTVCDMIHERFPTQFTGPDIEVPKKKAAAVARADHIIAISQNTRDDLIDLLGVDSGKVSVIPLASSFNSSQEVTNLGMKEGDRPFLLYVGVRRGVKNFATLFKAFVRSEMLKNNFDLICAGGGGFSSEEAQVIAKEGVSDRVKQVQTNDRMLASLYTQAAVFIYPSLYEGFGLPLLEAMQCGCPVVSSKTSSMPEIGGDAAIYFDPQNEEELRLAVESVIESEERQQKLRKRGYERARLFTWEICAQRTADLYRRLM